MERGFSVAWRKNCPCSCVFQKLDKRLWSVCEKPQTVPVAAMSMWEGGMEVMKQRPAHAEAPGCCAKGPRSCFTGGSRSFEGFDARNNMSRFHFW